MLGGGDILKLGNAEEFVQHKVVSWSVLLVQWLGGDYIGNSSF
jgi:hypothetical protein